LRLTGRLAGITFRVADVNDVIFNMLGTAVGFVLFLGFGVVFRRAANKCDTIRSGFSVKF